MLTLPDVDADLWDRFHEARERVPRPFDRPWLSRWERSRTLGARLDDRPVFLGRDLVRERQERAAELLSRAEDQLDDAFAELRRRGFTIVVADSEGVILRAWGGEALGDPNLEEGLSVGARWDEATRGTNAIGTALIERTACSVVGRAHYSLVGAQLCCYSSLIEDPFGGSLAVLNISGRKDAADSLAGPLVQGLATGVESSLRARYAASRERELSGIVAHELRNPLSTVRLSAKMLERAMSPEERPKLKTIGTIAEAATRMARIIDDLLDAATLDAGHFSLARAAIDGATLARDAFEMTRPIASALTVHLDLEDDLPWVYVDRDRVMQIFANLIGNAVKFTPPGGAVVVGARRDGKKVRFWVKDSGKGLSPDEARHAFERFWQAQRTDRRGVGLGLFICKRLVEEHAGEIWVESRPGAGAAFIFTLPTAAAPS